MYKYCVNMNMNTWKDNNYDHKCKYEDNYEYKYEM